MVGQNRCLGSADGHERNSSRHTIRYVQLAWLGYDYNDSFNLRLRHAVGDLAVIGHGQL